MTHSISRRTLFVASLLLSLGSAAAHAQETYTVEHKFGTAEIPVDYERVVVSALRVLDSALAAGVVPVAAPRSAQGHPDYLPETADAITDLGTDEENIDLELIAAQDPDLIIIHIDDDETPEEVNYEALSRIAPTVTILAGRHNFEDAAAQIGRALNREAEIAAVKADYDARTAKIAANLAATPFASETFSMPRLMPDHIRVMMDMSNPGRVLRAAGLTIAPLPEGSELIGAAGAYYEASLEILPEAMGDNLFVFSTHDGVLEEQTALPIWQEIPAVQAGKAYPVDYRSWMIGQGYYAAHSILDDAEAALGLPPTR
jgi:iron complex transport system substrate-binding protein